MRFLLALKDEVSARSSDETKSGHNIDVPMVSSVFSETALWEISVYAKDAIERVHRNSHKTDGSALRSTFEALAGFQRLSLGLHVLNRYFIPSAFTRNDNLFEAVEFQLTSIDSAIKGITEKPTYGPEYNETGERLAALANSLRATLEAVEWEMAAFPAYSDYRAAPKP
jgi:hypothetical protein